MTQYAGNLYDTTKSKDVALNTQRVQSSSLFGTRKLKFFTFSIYFTLYTDTPRFDTNKIDVTGGTATGKQVTYEFAEQATAPYAVGDTIYVYDMDHDIYDGEYTVVAATTSSVTVDWYKFGNPVTGGSIVRAGFNDPDSFYSYIVRAIQKVAEVYYLGAPTYVDFELFPSDYFGNFVFAISDELTTTDYDEQGYDQPEEGHDAAENSHPTDLASAILQALGNGDWYGYNGDGWSVAECQDLGWGLMPGPLAGDPGWSLANPNGFNFTPSDIRLKRNINLVETRNGIKIYSFQYLWSDEYFVGVMAQDLLGTEHESAVIEHNGFYTVNYGQLGFNMQLLSEYNATTV
jgi:hypothetical protein